MLAVSIVLFFICVFLSMMMALFDQDKRVIQRLFLPSMAILFIIWIVLFSIIVWIYTSFNIQSSNIWIAILLMVHIA